MFKNVLVGVDFRPGGRDAIALATQLLDRGGTLTLAYVFPGGAVPSYVITPGLLGEERERAEAQLEQERADADVEAEAVVVESASPGRGLHETAESRASDLLVLGSTHRGIFGRAMLGDDTRDAIDGAPCAVAVAPTGFAQQAKPLATIGVGYDGSPESETALATARALAASHNARVRALRVVTLGGYRYAGMMMMGEINQFVEEDDARMKALEGVEGHAEYGLPVEDLTAFAKEVDLLIVGSRGYGPWGRLVHGSTSAQLARHTGGPLLIVPRTKPGGVHDDAGADRTAITA